MERLVLLDALDGGRPTSLADALGPHASVCVLLRHFA